MFCLFHLLRVKTLKVNYWKTATVCFFKSCTCSITLAVCDFVTVTMVPRKSASYRLPIAFTLSCSYSKNPALAGFAIRNPANPAILKKQIRYSPKKLNMFSLEIFCLDLSPYRFTTPTRTRQDSVVLSVSVVWTRHKKVQYCYTYCA